MKNSEIAKILRHMAVFYEMQDAPFKPRAYEKAAQAIADFDEQMTDVYRRDGAAGFRKIPGVGPGIGEHLDELVNTGRLKKYEALRKKFPINLDELGNLQGVGPKTLKALYQKLKVKNLRDLGHALAKHQVSRLPGFGKLTEEKIYKSFQFRKSHSGRFLLGDVYPIVRDLSHRLEFSGLFTKVMVGGSYRRMQETVGDIDILAVAKDPKRAGNFFARLPEVVRVLEHGESKSEIMLEHGLQVDLRLVQEKNWGAASQYFTGDKAHNVKLRKIAISKGLKLSEYGLFRGNKMVAGKTEEEVYKKLGMAWVPPELRTDSGEIEAAQKNQLPKLLEYGQLRGDLQVQTDWTDGANSIAQMAEAAQKLGREYICITDHTTSLYMTGGLNAKKLEKQGQEIKKLNAKFKKQNLKFLILHGAEVNILKDGSLDISDKMLSKLDVVGVSIHSLFNLTRSDMTKRIEKALSNPNVDIFFHPTTRVIQKRDPIDFDFARILAVAKKHKVALEIDALPDRLDIHDTLVRQAINGGVKLTIDSDAHSVHHLDFLRFGEGQARRGWAQAKDVLNTLPANQLLEYFRKK